MSDKITSAAEQLPAVEAGSSAGIEIGRASRGNDVLYGIAVAVAIYRIRRKATGRITAQRYRVGFLFTISLYGIGVALSVTTGPALPLWFWLPYIVATVLPMIISSSLRVP